MKLSQPSPFREGEDRGGCSPPCALCWVWGGEGALAVHGVRMGCKLPDAPSFSLLPNIFFLHYSKARVAWLKGSWSPL